METCRICQKPFKTLTGVAVHVRQVHGIATEDYYNKYLKKGPKDGVCLDCGARCHFTSLQAGYAQKYCSVKCCHAEEGRQVIIRKAAKEKSLQESGRAVVCELCGDIFDGMPGLGQHVLWTHKMSTEDYHNKYLETNPDAGKCTLCGKPTRFDGMGRGYIKHCGRKCAANEPENKALYSRLFTGRTLSEETTKKIVANLAHRMELQYELTGSYTTKAGFTTVGKDEFAFIKKLIPVSRFTINCQHPVNGRLIDGYIQELCLAIEFDEDHHQFPSEQAKDAKREILLRQAIPNIDFFRVTQKDWKKDPESVLRLFKERISLDHVANKSFKRMCTRLSTIASSANRIRVNWHLPPELVMGALGIEAKLLREDFQILKEYDFGFLGYDYEGGLKFETTTTELPALLDFVKTFHKGYELPYVLEGQEIIQFMICHPGNRGCVDEAAKECGLVRSSAFKDMFWVIEAA